MQQPVDPKPDEPKIFRLKVGDILNIKSAKYEVMKIMSGGRIMIKRRD